MVLMSRAHCKYADSLTLAHFRYATGCWTCVHTPSLSVLALHLCPFCTSPFPADMRLLDAHARAHSDPDRGVFVGRSVSLPPPSTSLSLSLARSLLRSPSCAPLRLPLSLSCAHSVSLSRALALALSRLQWRRWPSGRRRALLTREPSCGRVPTT